MRLISSNDIIGHLSRWAVQLHPYKRPEGLFDFVQDVASKCEEQFKDGITSLPMRWFGSHQAVLQWLRCFEHAALRAWNEPKSGHAAPITFTSRYGGPKPEDEFIDIGALWMNVARGVWDDAAEFEKPASNANEHQSALSN